MYSLLDDSTSDLRSKKFKKLTKAICGLVSFLSCGCCFSMLWLVGVYWFLVSGHHYGKHDPTQFPCKGEVVVRGCGLASQQFNLEAVIGSSQKLN